MGEFKEGFKSDYGLYFFANGDTYKGDWYKNKFHGKGIFTYNNT